MSVLQALAAQLHGCKCSSMRKTWIMTHCLGRSMVLGTFCKANPPLFPPPLWPVTLQILFILSAPVIEPSPALKHVHAIHCLSQRRLLSLVATVWQPGSPQTAPQVPSQGASLSLLSLMPCQAMTRATQAMQHRQWGVILCVHAFASACAFECNCTLADKQRSACFFCARSR